MADKKPSPKDEKPAPGFSLSTFLWGTALGAAVYYGYTQRAKAVRLARQLEATVTQVVSTVTPGTPETPPTTTTTTTPPVLPRVSSVTVTLANARAAGAPYQVGDTVAIAASTVVTPSGTAPEYRVTATKPGSNEAVTSGWVATLGGGVVLEPTAGTTGVGTWRVKVEARLPVAAANDSTVVTSAETPIEVVAAPVAPSTGAAGRVYGFPGRR